jgi:hypothetical protein
MSGEHSIFQMGRSGFERSLPEFSAFDYYCGLLQVMIID